MKVASLNIGEHDSSLSFFDGENLLYFLQERYSKIKHDGHYFYCLEKFLDINCEVDLFVISSSDQTLFKNIINADCYKTLLLNYKKKYNSTLKVIFDSSHHLFHASLAFYNSKFDKSLVIVVDGSGKTEGSIRECESVYIAEYPCKFIPVYKNYLIVSDNYHSDLTRLKNKNPQCEIVAKSKLGIGAIYGSGASHFGENELSAGKVMGLQSYGSDLKLQFIKDDLYVDDNHFCIKFCTNSRSVLVYNKNIPITDKITKNNIKIFSDYAKTLQSQTENVVVNLISKYTNQTGIKNVCITGGYGMNVVANSNYRKKFPNIKFYNEPLSTDCGISLGSCFYYYRTATKDTEIKNIKTPYFQGQNTSNYIYDLNDTEIDIEVTPKQVSSLLKEGNVCAIFQGKSEAGPRALGNRSILFDPRVVNGKDIINTIKKREYYRPFAGTVLLEHANEWFDMQDFDESPLMMYSINVLSEKENKIPAIVHVDKTCRIQTLSKDQNNYFYSLIEQFYNLTGVPILLNTSFNLAGQPIVETLYDALLVLRKSQIEYLYLPEISRLIKIPNQKLDFN